MGILKYVNHLGEEIVFTGKNHFTNSYVMRDYTWNYKSDFNRIKSFNLSKVTTKNLTVSIYAKRQKEPFEFLNSVFEVFEKDVLAKSPGKFYLDKYYFRGYVIGSTKKQYIEAQKLLTMELTVISDTNTWINEETYSFEKNQPISGHGYVYGYPYQYSSGTSKTFLNDTLISSNFKLRIYGPCYNPNIYISGHVYAVNTEVENKEYLEINSLKKTIFKVQKDGTKINALNFRDRTNYIFEKIPSGIVPVSWNNNFGFDITIYDERSEPRWS